MERKAGVCGWQSSIAVHREIRKQRLSSDYKADHS